MNVYATMVYSMLLFYEPATATASRGVIDDSGTRTAACAACTLPAACLQHACSKQHARACSQLDACAKKLDNF